MAFKTFNCNKFKTQFTTSVKQQGQTFKGKPSLTTSLCAY